MSASKHRRLDLSVNYSAFRQKFPKLWTSVAHSFLQQIAQNKNWAHPKATTLPRICKVEMQQASLLYYSAKPQSGGILGCALVCPTSLYVRTIRFPMFCRSLPSVGAYPQYPACSPWANLKKASRSWLLFQIERAKVWSPRWVENDKRKGFGGVVEICGVQTLSKNRFFWSVRQGRRSSMRLTPFVSISLWFTADSFVICRRCREMASMAELASEILKCSRRCKEMFWTFQSGWRAFWRVKMCVWFTWRVFGSLNLSCFDYSLRWESCFNVVWLYLSSTCVRKTSSLRSQIPFFFLINNFPELPIFHHAFQ